MGGKSSAKRFYTLHIEFDDGSNPWVRFNMTRIEYGYEMGRWKARYKMTVDKTEETQNGGVVIFAKASAKSKEEKNNDLHKGKCCKDGKGCRCGAGGACGGSCKRGPVHE